MYYIHVERITAIFLKADLGYFGRHQTPPRFGHILLPGGLLLLF
jgi:hypothetical protein